VKLSPKKVKWIINQKKKGVSSTEIANVQKVTPRRVQQIWKKFCDAGEIPVIGKNIGRPLKNLTDSEKELISSTYSRYKFGALYLEKIIQFEKGMNISHNKIHSHLLKMGVVKTSEKKRKQRKYCRYERKHSMSAAHIDWHYNPELSLQICAIIDDSSRMILAAEEYVSSNTENTIKTVSSMIKDYCTICPLRELIMDHGSEFGAHRRNSDGSWDSEFKQFLTKHNILPILARVKHPQTNGKIEKWFHTYQRFRSEFDSLEDFIMWYNNRPHGSLNFDELETPEQAFWRRLPEEAKMGIAVRLFNL